MIRKTREFDNQFNRDLREITFNKNKPPEIFGSYGIREFGSYINDIDINTYVRYSEKLLKLIVLQIDTAKKFHFLFIKCGSYDDYSFPWHIDKIGSCVFNLDKAKEWLNKMKSEDLLPEDVIKSIHSILYKDKIYISDLIRIYDIVKGFSTIKWSRDDLARGYVDKKGKRYYFLDVIKKNRCLMKYLYDAGNGKYVLIEIGLLDNEYPSFDFGTNMYKYYDQMLYKILKGFRWRILPEYSDQYRKYMERVEFVVALRYYVEVFRDLIKFKIIKTRQEVERIKNDITKYLDEIDFNHKGKKLPELEKELDELTDSMLDKKYIQEQLSHMKPKYKKEMIMYYFRGLDAQIPTKTDDLNRQDVSCPFFNIDINEYEKIIDLALRMEVDPELMIKCFSKLDNDTINKLILDTGLSITTSTSDITLKKYNKIIDTYPISFKQNLQKYIFNSEEESLPIFKKPVVEFKPVDTRVSIDLEYVKKVDFEKNILVCSSVFKLKDSYKDWSKYADGIRTILNQIDDEYVKNPDCGIVYRMYYDDSMGTEKIIDEIKQKKYCELVKYNCEPYKSEGYHYGIFGTLMRFLPMFDSYKRDWNVYCCVDIDSPLPLANIFKFEKSSDQFFFKTKPCYYIRKHVNIEGMKTTDRIIASSIFSKIQFDSNIFFNFLTEFINREKPYQVFKKMLLESNYITEDEFENRYNKFEKDNGVVYGLDEFFINDYILRYVIDNNIKYMRIMNFDDYSRALSIIFINNNSMEGLSPDTSIFYTEFLKNILESRYNDEKSLRENFKYLLSENKKYLFKSQQEILKAIENGDAEKYNIPSVITDCVKLKRPLKLY